jgi:uncharacterized protein YggU (UPF0235/DUF167 family)
MKIFVKAKPGAKRARITENSDLFGRGSDRHFVVSVTERAIEGKANEAIIQAIAAHLKVAPSRVSMTSGQTSRDKVLEIEEREKEKEK